MKLRNIFSLLQVYKTKIYLIYQLRHVQASKYDIVQIVTQLTNHQHGIHNKSLGLFFPTVWSYCISDQ